MNVLDPRLICLKLPKIKFRALTGGIPLIDLNSGSYFKYQKCFKLLMLTKTTVHVMALTANVLCDDFCDDKVDKGLFDLCTLWKENALLLDRLRELLGMSAG